MVAFHPGESVTRIMSRLGAEASIVKLQLLDTRWLTRDTGPEAFELLSLTREKRDELGTE